VTQNSRSTADPAADHAPLLMDSMTLFRRGGNRPIRIVSHVAMEVMHVLHLTKILKYVSTSSTQLGPIMHMFAVSQNSMCAITNAEIS
jgi:hypothetical protein